MSSPLLPINPQFVYEVTPVYTTIATDFESGHVQTRAKFDKVQRIFNLEWTNATESEWRQLMNFIDGQKGGATEFYFQSPIHAAVEQDSLIVNGDFETGASTPDNWALNVTSPAVADALAVDTTWFIRGTRSAKIVITTPGDSRDDVSFDTTGAQISAVDGTQYRVEGFIKVSAAVTMDVKIGAISDTITTTLGTGVNYLDATVTASSTASANLLFQFADANATVNFDRIIITEVTQQTKVSMIPGAFTWRKNQPGQYTMELRLQERF